MKLLALYKTLEKNGYYLFSLDDLLVFHLHEKKASLKEALYRWKKKGWVHQLKRGLYELAYPKDIVIPDMYIANSLYSPSYVSLETALSNYSIIPEVAMGVTSITTKPTRKFRNRHGLFVYRSVKPAAFTGYHIQKQGAFSVRIAEPEKAVADFIYFKTYRGGRFNAQDERMSREAILRLNKRRISHYAGLYNLDLKEIYAQL